MGRSADRGIWIPEGSLVGDCRPGFPGNFYRNRPPGPPRSPGPAPRINLHEKSDPHENSRAKLRRTKNPARLRGFAIWLTVHGLLKHGARPSNVTCLHMGVALTGGQIESQVAVKILEPSCGERKVKILEPSCGERKIQTLVKILEPSCGKRSFKTVLLKETRVPDTTGSF